MEFIKLAALCVICLLPVTLLRKQSPEQALLLITAVLAVVLARCLMLAVPLMEEIGDLFRQAGIEPSYISILLRTTAAALVTRFCADVCRDGGSQTLATLSETAGAVAALAISLPLLQAVVKLL